MNARVAVIVVCMILMAVAGALAGPRPVVRTMTEDGLGIGLVVGEPTGVSVKKWISPENALDAGLGWSFSEHESLQFHGDFLIHNFNVLKTEVHAGRLPVYFGVGGRLKLQDENHGREHDGDASIGVRIPFGISYLFDKSPVDIFAEIVPILDVVPDADFDINAAIGVRVYFL